MAQASEWRILAEEAAEETDSERLIEIVGALIRAIDEQEMHPKTRMTQPASSHCQLSLPGRRAQTLINSN